MDHAATIDAREAERLRVLRGYRILDTPPEEAFDRIVRIAARAFDVPYAFLTLVDGDRQWFKAKHGLDVEETDRAVSFCTHTIEGDDVLVVKDALQDPRLADNPFVAGPPGVRFYAGAPLRSSEGFNLGALCVIDSKPRRLDDEERALLRDLAAHVMELLESRLEAFEDVVLQSEERFRSVFEGSPLGIAFSRDEHVVLANRAFRKMFGISPGEPVRGRAVEEFVAPEVRERILERSRARTRGESVPAAYETVGLRADGSRFPLFVRAARVMLSDGPANVAFVADISERKQAAQALERAQFAMQNAGDAIFWVGPDGHFLHVNAAACRSVGYEAEELVGRPVGEIDPNFEPEAVADVFAEVREDGYRTLRSVHRRRDGSEFPVEVNVTHLSIDGEEMFCAFARDISDRVAAEEALRHSERRYRTILASIEDGYYESDVRGHLTFFNDALSEVLGYPPEELGGLSYREFMDADNAHRVLRAFNEVFRTGEPVTGLEWESICKDGSRRYLQASVSLMEDEDGEVTGFRGIIRDVTQQRNLEKQLRQAQKLEAIGQLAGGVAHDFNNLLTGISGYAQMAKNPLEEDHPLREDLGRIIEFTERGADLTKRLLAFSRRQSIDPIPVNVNNLVDGVARMLRRMIGEDIEIEVQPGENPYPVEVDPSEMEQVLLNLATNARDAMPNGGRLVLETANAEIDGGYVLHHGGVVEPGSYVRISVTDSGCGMDRQTQERIFEPFFTTKDVGKGTGLGLSMAYGIVKQHGGYIWVYSERDRGTTFKIYLPRAEFEADELLPDALARRRAEEEAAANEELPCGSETILLVEDEDSVRIIAERALINQGYDVLSATDPEQAELLFDECGGSVRLLLTDVVMPGMDGRELAERLRARDASLRTLYMSGYPDKAVQRNGAPGDYRPMLQKPFSPGQLVRRVRHVLDHE